MFRVYEFYSFIQMNEIKLSTFSQIYLYLYIASHEFTPIIRDGWLPTSFIPQTLIVENIEIIHAVWSHNEGCCLMYPGVDGNLCKCTYINGHLYIYEKNVCYVNVYIKWENYKGKKYSGLEKKQTPPLYLIIFFFFLTSLRYHFWV